MPLFECGQSPAVARRHDLRPDYPLKPSVVREDWQAGEHVSREIGGDAIAGTPDAHWTTSDCVAGDPNFGAPMFRAHESSHLAQVEGRPGLEVDEHAMLGQVGDFRLFDRGRGGGGIASVPVVPVLKKFTG